MVEFLYELLHCVKEHADAAHIKGVKTMSKRDDKVEALRPTETCEFFDAVKKERLKYEPKRSAFLAKPRMGDTPEEAFKRSQGKFKATLRKLAQDD